MVKQSGLANRVTGFTLIEVLVALAIMAVMAGMAWRGIDAVLRSREISQTKLDQVAKLQTVLAQWEQDLAQLQDSQVVPALGFDGASLRFTRSTEQGLQVVVWSLTDGQWQRWASAPTTTQTALYDAYQRSLSTLGQRAGALRTLDGLQEWLVYFYRENGWSNAQSSDDEEKAQLQPQQPQQGQQGQQPPRKKLPTGIRIVLRFAPDNGYGGPVTRQLLLGPQPQ
ncbi:prepilin-type N-terminal cleavage/methylation domain-containing protein [Pelomonas sp. V22]|nr:prepilin-type N-terminal cleavage/methylation domain-containing protein [Pelomonas sp. V22]